MLIDIFSWQHRWITALLGHTVRAGPLFEGEAEPEHVLLAFLEWDAAAAVYSSRGDEVVGVFRRLMVESARDQWERSARTRTSRTSRRTALGPEAPFGAELREEVTGSKRGIESSESEATSKRRRAGTVTATGGGGRSEAQAGRSKDDYAEMTAGGPRWELYGDMK